MVSGHVREYELSYFVLIPFHKSPDKVLTSKNANNMILLVIYHSCSGAIARSKFRTEMMLLERCVLFIIPLSAGKLKGREMKGVYIVSVSSLFAHAIFTNRVFHRELIRAGCESNMKQKWFISLTLMLEDAVDCKIKNYLSFSCCLPFIPLLLRFQLLSCAGSQILATVY